MKWSFLTHPAFVAAVLLSLAGAALCYSEATLMARLMLEYMPQLGISEGSSVLVCISWVVTPPLLLVSRPGGASSSRGLLRFLAFSLILLAPALLWLSVSYGRSDAPMYTLEPAFSSAGLAGFVFLSTACCSLTLWILFVQLQHCMTALLIHSRKDAQHQENL